MKRNLVLVTTILVVGSLWGLFAPQVQAQEGTGLKYVQCFAFAGNAPSLDGEGDCHCGVPPWEGWDQAEMAWTRGGNPCFPTSGEERGYLIEGWDVKKIFGAPAPVPEALESEAPVSVVTPVEATPEATPAPAPEANPVPVEVTPIPALATKAETPEWVSPDWENLFAVLSTICGGLPFTVWIAIAIIFFVFTPIGRWTMSFFRSTGEAHDVVTAPDGKGGWIERGYRRPWLEGLFRGMASSRPPMGSPKPFAGSAAKWGQFLIWLFFAGVGGGLLLLLLLLEKGWIVW